jgi:hypothetical protein
MSAHKAPVTVWTSMTTAASDQRPRIGDATCRLNRRRTPIQ